MSHSKFDDFFSESDADSDITGGTMAPLCDFLLEYTDNTHEEVQQLLQQQEQQRRTSTVADSVSADVQSDADSVRSDRSDRTGKSSRSGSKSAASSGSKRRKSSAAAAADSVNSSMDSLGSLGGSASMTSKGRLPLRKAGRQSLSTSTVLEGPQTKKSKLRHSLGPIVSTAAAPTVSSASKSKAKLPTSAAKTAPAAVPTPVPAPASVAPVIIAPAVAAAAASLNTSMAPPGSALKSCLSTRKQHPAGMRFDLDSSATASAVKRNVIFGSPQACEVNKTSPTTNFTPLHHDHAKSLFSMAVAGSSISEGEDRPADPVTEENDRILAEWDRLSNASSCGSDSGKFVDVILVGQF